MRVVYIIDTSVLLNLLGVPTKSQDSEQIREEYTERMGSGAEFVLPVAVIIETGNHVAQNGDGRTRRKIAENFCGMVRESINGEGSFRPCKLSSLKDVLSWLDDFPGLAGANISAKRGKPEGISFGDLNIIKEWERWSEYIPGGNVKIWSLDRSLQSHNSAH